MSSSWGSPLIVRQVRDVRPPQDYHGIPGTPHMVAQLHFGMRLKLKQQTLIDAHSSSCLERWFPCVGFWPSGRYDSSLQTFQQPSHARIWPHEGNHVHNITLHHLFPYITYLLQLFKIFKIIISVTDWGGLFWIFLIIRATMLYKGSHWYVIVLWELRDLTKALAYINV